MTPQIDALIRQIEEKLPRHSSVEAAAEDVLNTLKVFGVKADENLLSDLKAAVEAVHARLGPIEVLRRNSLLKRREEWYHGPSPRDLHWPPLRDYLKNTKGWGEAAVASIDGTSNEVVSLLTNPKTDSFRCRGLVVGYVQSGKTANMTAVIAKAVDAGYNLIVVLAGVTNKLRAQTQKRLFDDVVTRNRHHWVMYTTLEENGDFLVPANGSFTMPKTGMAQLAVMKKETNRLDSFLRTVTGTPPAILKQIRALIIDDECDQASVNSAQGDFDMTRINEKIRRIIKALPAVSYIGYTATPFANVFINPFPHNADELDDLYPEDFITALPRPEGYFGTREVFGQEPDDPDQETEAGRNMIREITDDLDFYRPARAKDHPGFRPMMGPDLRDAILWFLASCAIRRSRGHSDKHMTMLVHTSANIAPHERTAELIRSWLEEHGPGIRAGKGHMYRRLVDVVNDEASSVEPVKPFPSGPELLRLLGETLDELEVVVENSESLERLEYSDEPRTYIVVGGSVLSRGLTLEGLCVSFFLRTSRQYDTLLQMGRWFGYRHGYEDLPRLWTTTELAADFRALAAIEEEIREEIAQYRANNATPIDFAVRVRAIPGMAITSASKMRHAHRTSISFDGRHIQTIRFDHQDADVVAGNWKAASRLIDRIIEHSDPHNQHLFRKVPFELVRNFLGDYRISDAHMDLKQDMLLGYLDVAHTMLGEWNVGVISASEGTRSALTLGRLGNVHTVKRAKLASPRTLFADIKALMSKQDILIDAEDKSIEPGIKWPTLKARRPAVPLLLLYPIDRVSEPRQSSHTRARLDAVGDIIGIGIVFPGKEDNSGNYYSVQLDSISADDIEAEDASNAGGCV